MQHHLLPYKPDHSAGVTEYAPYKNGIITLFQDGRYYFYDSDSPGVKHVREMLVRAKQGKELTSYINKYVREKYRLMGHSLEKLLLEIERLYSKK